MFGPTLGIIRPPIQWVAVALFTKVKRPEGNADRSMHRWDNNVKWLLNNNERMRTTLVRIRIDPSGEWSNTTMISRVLNQLSDYELRNKRFFLLQMELLNRSAS
jgi:hypothetical protein